MMQSTIEEDLTIDGNVSSENGDVHVKGTVTGDIRARSVDVHAMGHVKGAVEADHVRIQGRQSGRIKCLELALDANAEVKSDVIAQTLTSEKGARLIGKVQITGM